MTRVTAVRVEEVLSDMDKLVEELEEVKKHEKEIAGYRSIFPSFKTRIYGGIMHDFYSCVEKVFKIIAQDMDHVTPEGDAWHKKLLIQMYTPSKYRSPVIDKELYKNLDEYRRYRHVNRHIYGIYIDYERMAHLVELMPHVVVVFKNSISGFFEREIELEDEMGD